MSVDERVYDLPEQGYSTNSVQDYPEDYYDDGEFELYLGDPDEEYPRD